ncbi:uncharacterized protein LOC122724921 [Manihot esculenta]|uniref:uncharacterized protein LOC122724921 n=1 Tax=Manihot esculenta TaxID=3983 RepID=UPI001CC7B5BD|nr:uncharacterized protein LOC122724921 [Manihot esculenta]
MVAEGIRKKTEEEYTNADWKKIFSNAKTINIVHCVLDVTEYNRVLDCESAKAVWDKVEVTYEGTNKVKELKANLLVRDFELFEMKPGETIAKMSIRFTDLVNILKVLGKSFEEAELVKKILRSLLKSWKAKSIVIFDIKEFTRYSYDELIRSLIIHEMIFKKEIIEKEKGIALKSEKLTDGKKKYITLKIDTSEFSSIFNDEEEITMLTRKFKRVFRKGENKYKRFIKKYGQRMILNHIFTKIQKKLFAMSITNPVISDPIVQKSKRRKMKIKERKLWLQFGTQLMKVQVMNNEIDLYCMALEEEVVESSKEEDIEVIKSEQSNIEELELVFAKVYDEYKIYKRKCASLKLENISLRSKNISLNMVLKENEFYKVQIILFNNLKKELEISK